MTSHKFSALTLPASHKVSFAAVLLATSFATNTAFAQEAEQPTEEVKPPRPPLEERIPDEIKKEDATFFTITSENDNYGDGSDQDYTNGIRFSFYEYSAPPPDFAYALADILPTFKVNDTTSVYYSFGQNLYTPKDISNPNLQPNDRPYAAFLYGSAGLTSISGNHQDDIEVTLGVVGPMALGEETQTFVHDSLNVQEPEGWDNQLDNEPGLILSWERSWPEAASTEIGPLTFRVAPHTGVTLGNIYTYGAAGGTFEILPTAYKWQAPPMRVRPAIPGNGYFSVPKNVWAWSFFGGVEGRAMARNIFLDGNTFSDSHSVDKKIMVADANVGVSLAYGDTRFSYTLNWRSKEFDGQDGNTLFGAISVGFRF